MRCMLRVALRMLSHTIVMHSLAKSEEYEPALQIVDRIKSTGCKSDTLFYNSLIYVLGRAGRLSEASHTFWDRYASEWGDT